MEVTCSFNREKKLSEVNVGEKQKKMFLSVPYVEKNKNLGKVYKTFYPDISIVLMATATSSNLSSKGGGEKGKTKSPLILTSPGTHSSLLWLALR